MSTATKKQPDASSTPAPAPYGRERPVGDETIFKVTKEIVVKFIEVGRLSPANFSETFNEVHRTVRDAVRS